VAHMNTVKSADSNDCIMDGRKLFYVGMNLHGKAK
jgi:hypothetical protein